MAAFGRYHKDTIDTVTKQQSVTVASILRKKDIAKYQQCCKEKVSLKCTGVSHSRASTLVFNGNLSPNGFNRWFAEQRIYKVFCCF